MILKKLDLWLRDYWEFWDNNGQRLLQVVQVLHSGISAISAALTHMSPNTAAILLAISGFLGAIGRARAQNTVEIMAAKQPPAP
jgi:hypothetical protein